MPTMKPTTLKGPSDITTSPSPVTLEMMLEGWSGMHPASEVSFLRLNGTLRVCKIAYTIGKGALVMQAPGDTYREAFIEVSERVNRTVGTPSYSPSDITRRHPA